MRYQAWLLGLALAVPVLTGCGGGGSSIDGTGGGPAPQSPGGMMRVAVTDEPFPIEGVLEASVEIGRVEAHLREEDRWIVLSEETFTINLIGLSNGIVEEIINVAVDPGTYDRFRFITGPGRVVLDPASGAVAHPDRLQDVTIDGSLGEGYVFTVENGGLKFPSGPQTGIKVDVDPPIVVTSGLSGDLLLDFDLSKNFVFNGPVYREPGVKRVLFTPSVKASNTSTTGSVVVTVMSDEILLADPSDDLPLEGAEVWLEDATGTKVASTFSSADGFATLPAAPGTYTLKADKFGFGEGEVPGVEIVLANLTDAGTLVLAPADLVVTGTVKTSVDTTDTADDYPVEGVVVILDLAAPSHSDETTTDTSGQFTFDGLEEFEYRLLFTKEGFAPLETTRAPSDGPLDLLLDPLDQAVDATVEDGSGIAVGSGVTVTATDAFGNTWTADTDASGVAALTLPTGTYTFTATDGTTSYAAAAPVEVVGDTDAGTQDAVVLTPAA